MSETSPSRRRLVYFLPALVVLAIAAVAAWYMLSESDPQAIPSALIDKPAPDFALPPPEGLETGLSRADLDGKVSVVNVFASWCAPCLIEHPQIMRLSKMEGVQVVGLNYKNEPEKAVAWLKEHGNPYARIGADRDGRVAIDWGVYGVPETFLVDRRGRIRMKHVGPVTAEVLEEKLLPALRRLQE